MFWRPQAWTAGSSQLLILARESSNISTEIALLPVKRSNAASHHDPVRLVRFFTSNASLKQYPLMQMNSTMPLLIADDTIEIYRGRDREPISLLDPSSNPWDHVKVRIDERPLVWQFR